MTPDQILSIILDVCKERQVGEYGTFVAVLTAYAESDFKVSAVQRETVGVFQQNPRWWPGNLLDVRVATNNFLDDFLNKKNVHLNSPVQDAWMTQEWETNGHARFVNGRPVFDNEFLSQPETANYIRRVNDVVPMIVSRHVPS